MGRRRRVAKFSPSLREAGEGAGGRGPPAAGAIHNPSARAPFPRLTMTMLVRIDASAELGGGHRSSLRTPPMTIRLLLLALLLLAACSERRPPADAASAETRSAPAADSSGTHTVARGEPDLPDFGDPKLFLNLDSLRWAEWETRPQGDHGARLHALGIRPVRSDSTGAREPFDSTEMAGYDPYGERAGDYHFIDFSGDGVDDVVYSGAWYERNENGFGALEGTRIKLYQVMNGRAVQVLAHPGAVQRIFRGARGQPVSFRVVTHGCCSDPQWSMDYFAPARTGDTVKFAPHRRVMGREGIVMPARFMDRPRPFTVSNDRYLLRESPGIDPATADGEDWYRWEGHGNALAEYGRGARGIALAEQTDATGRVWWFVRMDGGTPPLSAQFTAAPNDPLPTDRLGWMSSRFLQAEP